MIVKAPEGYPCIPAQTCHAICFQCVSIGSQWSEKYKRYFDQAILAWELPNTRMDITKDGVTKSLPRVISQTYNLTLGLGSNLLRDITTWRGALTKEELKGFELSERLGKNCILVIGNKAKASGGTKAYVASVAPLMAGMMERKPEYPIVDYDMVRDGFDKLPVGVPNWFIENIKASKEYKIAMGQDVSGEETQGETAGTEEEEAAPTGSDIDIPF